MTYSALGIAARGSAGCEGGRVEAENGSCCPDKEWFNVEYILVKGWGSYRYHCEKKVRHALALMSPAALEARRWRAEGDLGTPVKIESGLAQQSARAAQHFETLYPAGRWVKVHDAVAKGTKCGPFNIWSAPATPVTPERQAAMRAVLAGLTGEAKARAEELGRDIGKDMIYSVPGSTPHERRGTMPQPEQLLAVQNGVVKPIGYGRKLLDFFAPTLRRQASFLIAARRALVKPEPLTMTTAVRQMVQQEARQRTAAKDEVTDDTEIPWLWIGVGAAALAAAGGGYWYYRTRG